MPDGGRFDLLFCAETEEQLKESDKMAEGLNTLGIAHKFLRERIKEGAFCIDATAGRGRDTALLCELTGPSGRVLAFDIQEAAVKATKAMLRECGFEDRAKVILDSHSNMDRYAQKESVDCIVFNFGYLPGGDHRVFTTPATSIPVIEKGLSLLKPRGVMSLCIYYGGDTGYEERDALLCYLKTLDSRVYTVLLHQFYNRPNDPPIPVFIYKES